MIKIKAEVQTIDSILEIWESHLEKDLLAYKNHAYRVFNISNLLSNMNEDDKTKIAIAASFHDLGIWANKTFDYLDPSKKLAIDYLESINKTDWSNEISLMIDFHHKITRYKNKSYPLVEIFRKADWIDVTRGKRSFGLSSDKIKFINNSFPNYGFHKKLAELTKKEFKKHPLKPMPMIKL